MIRKIALEEHVYVADAAHAHSSHDFGKTVRPDYLEEMRRCLPDREARLARMDAAGVDLAVLSLTQPGIQGQPSAELAVRSARAANDELYTRFVQWKPHRFAGFAAVPLQDPKQAADELSRCVKDLGFVGAMVNGYSNVGDVETGVYLDEEINLPFWERVAELDVPVYLHPRVALPSQQRIYRGYPALMGSAWGFGVETATHALRLILSGLFDRFPTVQLVLGHLGEGIPYAASRLDHRLPFSAPACRGRQLLKPSDYLNRNFYFTTSGFCRDQALRSVVAEVGTSRLLFASDYPFEDMVASAEWFESAPLTESERTAVATTNAARLLRRAL